MAKPYGSLLKRGPTILVRGSCAPSPARIESSEWMSEIRWALVTALNSTLSGLPKIAAAMARTMSMSNPSIFPSRGLR